MVASQTGSQGINWWSMAALSTAAIAPLVLIGIFLERYIVSGLTTGSGKIAPAHLSSALTELDVVSASEIRLFRPTADPRVMSRRVGDRHPTLALWVAASPCLKSGQ